MSNPPAFFPFPFYVSGTESALPQTALQTPWTLLSHYMLFCRTGRFTRNLYHPTDRFTVAPLTAIPASPTPPTHGWTHRSRRQTPAHDTGLYLRARYSGPLGRHSLLIGSSSTSLDSGHATLVHVGAEASGFETRTAFLWPAQVAPLDQTTGLNSCRSIESFFTGIGRSGPLGSSARASRVPTAP